jgi:hypothetical protein
MDQLTTTVAEVEEQEIQDVLAYFSGLTPWAAIRLLVRVLVSNGTLTAKQVERALGKAE